MDKLEEDKLEEFVLDFSKTRNGQLDESFLRMFGNLTKSLLKYIFGSGSKPNVKISGTKTEIDAYMKALSAETKYVNVARQYGLDDPRTYKNKAKLTSQAAAFKRKTGMNWPVGM
jgi:hypothetical protein